MAQIIEIDDDIFHHLQEQAVPLVDTPSTVLRRLLGLSGPDNGHGQTVDVGQSAGRNLNEEPNQQYPAARSPRGDRARARVRAHAQSPPMRRPSGDLLAIEDYRPALLRFLSDQPNGEAHVRDVMQGVGRALADALTPTDLEEVEPGKPYWHNRLPWAGTEARKAGLLATDAPRGVWRLTEKGREAAAMMGVNGQ